MGTSYLYTGIARNPNGFRELNEFLSYHNETGLPLPERAPPLDDVWFIYDFSENPWEGTGSGTGGQRCGSRSSSGCVRVR